MAEKINWSSKDPEEEYEYTHNWANRLLVNGADAGDTILQANVAPAGKEPSFESSDVLLVCFAIVPKAGSATEIEYWVRGGLAGGRADITIGVWTAQGRHYEEGIRLPIKER